MNYQVGDLFIEQNKVEDNRNNESEKIFYVVNIRTSIFEGIEHIWIETKNPKEQHTRTIEANSLEYLVATDNYKHFPVK